MRTTVIIKSGLFQYNKYLLASYHENKNRPTDQENFWIVNDSLFVSPLIPILRDIRKFAILSGEAIVIDFGDFPIGIVITT